MIVDRNGKEIAIGSIVIVRLVVTNLVADSERVNIVCAHADPQPGLPDDLRIALASQFVECLSSPAKIQEAPVPELELHSAASE